jgi:hypothetical protein
MERQLHSHTKSPPPKSPPPICRFWLAAEPSVATSEPSVATSEATSDLEPRTGRGTQKSIPYACFQLQAGAAAGLFADPPARGDGATVSTISTVSTVSTVFASLLQRVHRGGCAGAGKRRSTRRTCSESRRRRWSTRSGYSVPAAIE